MSGREILQMCRWLWPVWACLLIPPIVVFAVSCAHAAPLEHMGAWPLPPREVQGAVRGPCAVNHEGKLSCAYVSSGANALCVLVLEIATPQAVIDGPWEMFGPLCGAQVVFPGMRGPNDGTL